MQKLRRESARLDADVAPLSHVCSQGVRATAAWPPGTVKSPICSRASSTLASRSVRRRVCGVRSSAVRCVQRPQPIVADSALVPACWAPVPPPPPPAPWQGRLRALVERTVQSCGVITSAFDARRVRPVHDASVASTVRLEAEVVSCVRRTGRRLCAAKSCLLAGCLRPVRTWSPGVRKSPVRSRTLAAPLRVPRGERCWVAAPRFSHAGSPPASRSVRRSVCCGRSSAVHCVQGQQLITSDPVLAPARPAAIVSRLPPAQWQGRLNALVGCTLPDCGLITGAFQAHGRVQAVPG
mmetsp:Transcript_12560/g.34257  ORF Transcript_12560/g.34257 Transcript_12560/m.34257 type:complete len:295 (-) Transcript_12560:270-1154(-)